LISRALAGARPGLGRTIGDIYFVNTVGSALGAFLAGFVLIPTLGLRGTLGLCIAINLVSAAAILAWQRQVTGIARWIPASAAAMAAVFALLHPPVVVGTGFTDGIYYSPKKHVEFGIEIQPVPGYASDETLYYREGVNATVSVHRSPTGTDLRINGKTDASLLDTSTQLLLGHLPMLFGRTEASRVLVIGCGSGMTAGAVTLHAPERVDLVELEPAVLEASRYFDDVNHRPLEHDTLRVITDDGRNFLSSTDRTYDVITSEPSNPWISGVSNLFTREAFAAAREALRPGGRFLQWIPLYGMDLEIVQSLLVALRSEFPHVYGFRYSASSSDLLLLATLEELTLDDLPVWDSMSADVRRDLGRIGVSSQTDVWSLLVLRPEEVDELIGDAVESNTDDSMFIELTAPWRLYSSASELDRLTSFDLGILPLLGRGADSGEIAELALSHLWFRSDPTMAWAVGREARLRGDSPELRILEAEWLVESDPRGSAAGLQQLGEVLTVEPELFLANYARARFLYGQRIHLGQALSDVDRALRARPRNWPARRLRLNILILLERWPEARAEAETLLASPYVEADTRLWADGALLAGALGRHEQGIREMRKYFEYSAFSSDEWAWMAKSLRTLGREREAAEADETVRRINHNRSRYGHRHALWQELGGSAEEAIQTLQQVVRMDPEYEAARVDLARLTTDSNR